LKGTVHANIFNQLLLSGSQVLLPLISYPYIARVLGPAALGRVNYADFLAQMAMIIAGFGIPFYAVRAVALVKNNLPARALLVKEITLLHLLFTGLVIALFFVFCFRDILQFPLLYGFAMSNILLSACSYEWYLQGTEAFGFAARRALLARALMLIAFFMLVKSPEDAAKYLGIYTAGSLVMAIATTHKIFKENHFVSQPIQPAKHLTPLVHFFITGAAISCYIYLDAVLLQQIGRNETATGYYTTVVKLVKVCLAALLAIGAVMLPRMSQVAQSGDLFGFRLQTNKVIETILTLALPASISIGLLAPELTLVIAGNEFAPAIPLMQWLAVLPLLIGLSNIFAFQVLVPLHHENKFLLAAISGCVLSIVLNIILIPKFGAAGTAWANIATEMAVTVITGYYAWKAIKFSIPTSMLLKTMLCCSLFVPTILGCRYLLVSPLAVLLVAIFLCGSLYICLQLLVFKNLPLQTVFAWLKQLSHKQAQAHGQT
jgi:O-antigen/teichoic acid export membrane protein